jgi:hypothetical protein
MNLTCPKNKDHDTFKASQSLERQVEMDREGNYTWTGEAEDVDTNHAEAYCVTCGAEAVDTEG